MLVNDATSKNDLIIPAEVEGCLDVAKQALTLLNRLSSPEYNQIAKPYLESSIGQHMRHVLDVFHAAMGWPHSEIIDYDLRRRTHLVESDKMIAIDEWHSISQCLKEISVEELNNKVNVKNEISLTHKKSALSKSTLGRELSFVSSHAIHHFALMRISLSFQDINVSKTFGMAPSTAIYHRGTQ